MQIYLARNNEQAGPYTLEQLNRMLASGQVVLTDLAWHEGMANWQPLQQLTGGRLYYDPNPSPNPFQSAPAASVMGAQTATHTHNTVNLQKSTTIPQPLAEAAPIAPIGKRLLGAALDFCLITLTSLPTLQYLDMAKIEKASQNNDMMQVITQMQAGIPPDAQLISNILLFVICAVQILLISRRGQSIGKLIVGTQIVQEDQKTPATFGKAVWVRTVLPWVLYSLPVINIVFFMATLTALLISPRRQALHDRLAKTVVVELPKPSSPHA